MKPDKFSIIAVVCTALTLVLNIAAYFFLPDTIITQIYLSGSGKHISTLFYCLAIIALILISAGMTIFTDKKRKWAVITSILTILNSIIILINLIK